MFQLHVPRKTTALIQILTSFMLLIIVLVLSFSPLITLDTSKHAEDIHNFMDQIPGAEDLDIEIPETVEISMPGLIRGFTLIGKVVSVAMDAVQEEVDDIRNDIEDIEENINNVQNAYNDAQNGNLSMDDPENLEKYTDENGNIDLNAGLLAPSDDKDNDRDSDTNKHAEELLDILKSEEGQESVIMLVAIVTTVVDSFEGFGDGLAVILVALVTLFALIYVIGFVLIIPIIILITMLAALISLLKNLNSLPDAAPQIGTRLPALIALPLTFMVVQCVLPGMNYTSNVTWLWVLALLGVLVNVVVSRLRAYTESDWKYITVLQSGALLAGIGYLLFFFNIIKTNIFMQFIEGEWMDYVLKIVEGAEMASKLGLSTENGYLIEMGLIILYGLIVLTSISYFKKCANRLSCTVNKGRESGATGDGNIVVAVITLIGVVIPFVCKGFENNYEYPYDPAHSDVSSFIKLSSSEESALTMALVGVIIMLVAEIAIIVLKKVFCSDTTRAQRIAVMTGHAPEPEAIASPVSEETASVESNSEASVEEVSAEEATVAEEAIVEETTEEAPATDEAVVEEVNENENANV